MRVLIACEFSGVVRDAFASRGHDAFSVDILPSESVGGIHYRADLFDFLQGFERRIDLIIAFPPCTHLSSSGAVYWPEKQKDGRQKEGFDFFMKISNLEVPKISIENPVGIVSTLWRKPDQIINPFQFGEPYRKKTCLWLKGLPLLVPTKIIEPLGSWCSGGQYGGRRKDGTRKITPSQLRTYRDAKNRSRTFKGIADAMAEQWGNLCS